MRSHCDRTAIAVLPHCLFLFVATESLSGKTLVKVSVCSCDFVPVRGMLRQMAFTLDESFEEVLAKLESEYSNFSSANLLTLSPLPNDKKY